MDPRTCIGPWLLLFPLALGPVEAWAGTHRDLSLDGGLIRIHAPSATEASGACTAALFGVGTGLTTGNYNSLGSAMNAQGFVFVLLDHAPGDAFGKADADRYANLAFEVQTRLLTDLALMGSGCTSIVRYVIGGHSASGQAAHAAAISTPSMGAAIFSADPFDMSGLGNVSLPGLYWGFNQTTCFVDKAKAGRAAYLRTPVPGRAFHRVSYQGCWFLGPPRYHHMSFIDYGLDLGSLGCLSGCSTPSSFYRDVAVSLRRFVDGWFGPLGWSKANLQIPGKSTPSTLYIDGEIP